MTVIKTKTAEPRNTPPDCPRFALVTPVAPPSPSGQSRVLGSLLEGLGPDRAVVLTEDGAAVSRGFHGFPYYRLPLGPVVQRILGILTRRLGTRHHDILLLALSWRIGQLARRHRSQVVIGCTASPYDIPAAWLAARRLGLPFIAYLFDDPVMQWTDPTMRALAKRWAERWMGEAAAVIAPNEVLARDVREAFGVHPLVLRNPAPPGAFRASGADEEAFAGQPVRIVYTGSIYHAHFDAFHNLLRAIPGLPFATELHVYTSQDRQWLESNGITGPVVWHDHIDDDAVFDVQRRAGILFLPLAFASDIPQVIRSSAPGKLGEYLASGRPVLAHVPAGSFVAEFLAARNCGYVVDVNEADAVREALLRIVEDQTATAAMVARAQEIAVKEFALEAIRGDFVQILCRAAASAGG